MPIKIAVPKETRPGERRVALTPDAASRLVKAGMAVAIQAGAGEQAFFSDGAYQEAGATIAGDRRALFPSSDAVLLINPLPHEKGNDDSELLPEGSLLIGFLDPFSNPGFVRRLVERRITALSIEMLPRISRAQNMDALTSQASVAGYKAALIAAERLAKFFPMLTTAAGTLAPAKVLVLGAGVAGLQAIATSRRLGAVVEAFDIRAAVKDEVRSLGATFLEVPLAGEHAAEGGYAKEVSEDEKKREQEMLREHIANSDVVITTAAVPGKKAPVLITGEMAAAMKPGSLIIDLAAEQGGNCELTQAGGEVTHQGATIIGPVNLPASMPSHASQMYARNISALLLHLVKDNALHIDLHDEIISAVCVTHEGKIRNETLKERMAPGERP